MSAKTKEGQGARAIALDTLLRVEREEAYSHIALDAAIKQHAPKPRERRLATRLVYGTLAMQRRLDAELSLAIDAPLIKKTDPFTRANLRLALYQLRCLDRVPAHAAVNAAVERVKARKGKRVAGFVNAVLRRLSREALPFEESARNETDRFGLRYSLPRGIARRLVERLGLQEAERCAERFNQVPPLSLRVNTSHGARAEIAAQLDATLGEAPQALRAEAFTPAIAEALERGAVAIQDEGSQRVVELALEHLPSAARVWDTCAGQGGKTSQIADEICARAPKAALLATELHASKLERLSALLTRTHPELALSSRALDLTQALPRELAEEEFDLILIDAPCSGLGVIGRHPETRWRGRLKALPELVELQRAILGQVIPRLAPGGRLTYAVCTFTREESTEQRDWILEHFPHLEIDTCAAPSLQALCPERAELALWPHLHATDAFYALRLRHKSHRGDRS